jgi:ATP-dependent protease HslVU (ClpYQ) peptidase subunit
MIGLPGSLRTKVVSPERPAIRRLVTLIAAVRSNEGIAVAADAQETVGDHRRAVQKIQAQTLGGVQFLIAGSAMLT